MSRAHHDTEYELPTWRLLGTYGICYIYKKRIQENIFSTSFKITLCHLCGFIQINTHFHQRSLHWLVDLPPQPAASRWFLLLHCSSACPLTPTLLTVTLNNFDTFQASITSVAKTFTGWVESLCNPNLLNGRVTLHQANWTKAVTHQWPMALCLCVSEL